jgi:hypothetical protein
VLRFSFFNFGGLIFVSFDQAKEKKEINIEFSKKSFSFQINKQYKKYMKILILIV